MPIMEPNGVERFRRELKRLGVRVVGTHFSLKWKCAVGDLNLGYTMGSDQIWTDYVGNRLPELEVYCEAYKQRLASAWGGEVKEGPSGTRYVVKGDGSRFLLHDLDKQQLRDWIVAIEELQHAVREYVTGD